MTKLNKPMTLFCFILTLILLGSCYANEEGLKTFDFSLKDTSGRKYQLSDYLGKTVVIEFFNPDCPFVKRAHRRMRYKRTIKSARQRGIIWFAVNANAAGKQGASLERNVTARDELKISYPILLNPSGSVARHFRAQRTPEFVVLNATHKVVYQGGLDSTSGTKPLNTSDELWLRRALNEHLDGKPLTLNRTKSWGCSIKY